MLLAPRKSGRALTESLGQRFWSRPTFRSWARFAPPVFGGRWRRFAPPLDGPWAEFTTPVPEALSGTPGIRRDPVLEAQAFAAAPLPKFDEHYNRSIEFLRRHMWRAMVPTSGRYMRASHRVIRSGREDSESALLAGSNAPRGDDLTAATVKRWGSELGLSAVGIAQYDEHYTWQPFLGDAPWKSVIVCVLEQNYDATQTIPSSYAEKAALSTYAEIMTRAVELAERIRSHGHRAQPGNPHGHDLFIHYAVQAGLGQLGLNGQLLTPQAGSRCRIVTIPTTAELTADGPRDFGVEKVCDSCQACVRRCPSGAIPKDRRMYRGVVKAKINTGRCLPLVAQLDGCAICIKVCPVQRYGLDKIYSHFEVTGQVLGVGTDDLEGYVWPIDSLFYGVDRKPRTPKSFFEHEEFTELPASPRAQGELAKSVRDPAPSGEAAG